jgi:polysaccharide pyruvyl transferase WcaK-like protein
MKPETKKHSNDDTAKICFFSAFPEFGNMGCNALTVSLMKLFTDRNPAAKFFFLHRLRYPVSKKIIISGKEVEMELVNCRLTPKSKIHENLFWIFLVILVYRLLPVKKLRNLICASTPWINVLVNADIIGTHFYGDSFSDIYGFKRLFDYSLLCSTAILFGKKIVLFPQTYGPYTSWLSKKIAYFIILHSSHVLARDKDGYEYVTQFLGRNKKNISIRFCPDLAFILESILPEKPSITPSIQPSDNDPLLGINISGLLYNGGYSGDNMFGLSCNYKEAMHSLVNTFLKKTNAHILLVPHVFADADNVESDNEACREIFKTISDAKSGRIHLITEKYNQNEIKGIIGQCDFFIGARMHACIAALSQGIPAVGIAYSKKFLGVFETVGVRNMVVDARQLSADELINQCMIHYKNREEARNVLGETLPHAKSLLIETINTIIQK